MTVVFVLLAMAALGAVGVLASGRVGRLPDAPPDLRPAASAPPFELALRGYRMDQVDEVLEVLQARVAECEAELARLRPS